MVRDAEGWNLELTCKIVWTQKKFYWIPKILDPKNIFGPKIFWGPIKFLGPNNFTHQF